MLRKAACSAMTSSLSDEIPAIKETISSLGCLTNCPKAQIAVAMWTGFCFLSMISRSLGMAERSLLLAKAMMALRWRIFFPRQEPAIIPNFSLNCPFDKSKNGISSGSAKSGSISTTGGLEIPLL